MSIQQQTNSLFSSQIDLNAYFSRIGYSGSAAPTLETLRALHYLHPQAIAFENLSSFRSEGKITSPFGQVILVGWWAGGLVGWWVGGLVGWSVILLS